MADIACAKFSPEQVDSLQAFQDSGVLPPYICTKHGGGQKLRATEDGLVCDVCLSVQDWAHTQTCNNEWRKLSAAVESESASA